MTRTLGLAAWLVAAGASAGLAGAGDIEGTVIFDGAARIPEGELAISFGGAAARAGDRTLRTVMTIDGGARAVAFSLPLPATGADAPFELVARLEREDGWLIARGSVVVRPGDTAPVEIVLNPAIY